MQRVISGWLSVVLVLLGVAVPGGAGAAARQDKSVERPQQMKATDEPVVEGPLTLEDTKCDRKARESGGETVAVIKRCLRFYRFDSTAETDPTNDYGVVWLQSNVKPRNGWCTKRAASDILLPEGAPVQAYQPKGRIEITAKHQSQTTELEATAGGTGGPGKVSQEWLGYPSGIRGFLKDEGRIYRIKWAGTTKAKLGFAGGAEISWPTDSPPEGLSYQLNFALGSPDAC
jgi:hypothetical protein